MTMHTKRKEKREIVTCPYLKPKGQKEDLERNKLKSLVIDVSAFDISAKGRLY